MLTVIQEQKSQSPATTCWHTVKTVVRRAAVGRAAVGRRRVAVRQNDWEGGKMTLLLHSAPAIGVRMALLADGSCLMYVHRSLSLWNYFVGFGERPSGKRLGFRGVLADES